MRSILLLTCSPKGPAAYSRLMAQEVADRLAAANPAADIVVIATSPPIRRRCPTPPSAPRCSAERRPTIPPSPPRRC